MKMNSSYIQQKENQFKQNLSYEEWLKIHKPEPTNDELNDMEKVFCKATILKSNSYPHNNYNYQPLQGA